MASGEVAIEVGFLMQFATKLGPMDERPDDDDRRQTNYQPTSEHHEAVA